ncbi:MAG: helicase-associated domain-containing protein [Chloroflexi bacterium]|nr:helicase-associated domain-containing protein [Chloroflexota bacterium]
MPSLLQSLQEHDLGHLRIVAEGWELDLDLPEVRTGRKTLARGLLKPGRAAEAFARLPEDARQALLALQAAGGRLPWPEFARQWGEPRPLGPGRRDRERPDRAPANPAETLWYRAWLARAFFDAPDGPQEFAYLPDDLAQRLPKAARTPVLPLGRPAAPAERKRRRPADDSILDHATTFLAARRAGLPLPPEAEGWGIHLPWLAALLHAAGLLDEHGEPQAETVKSFLETPRGRSLAALARAWLDSPDMNDLRLVPHLRAHGRWRNDPLKARRAVLALLPPPGLDAWWSIPAFIAEIKSTQPDFQRSGGEYDAWYIQDTRTGEYLRGEAHWDAVEGALLNFMLTGPLHWLGVLDLAAPAADSPPLAFRYSPLAAALLAGKALPGLPEEKDKALVDSRLHIRVPRLAPRAARYLIARFCDWEGMQKAVYRYRITPAGLERARKQGVATAQLLALLKKHSAGPLPPNLAPALARWEQHGAQAHLESVVVLRVAHPEILAQVRASRAARFLGAPLGPTSIAVRPGARQQVLDALAELGVLGELHEPEP